MSLTWLWSDIASRNYKRLQMATQSGKKDEVPESYCEKVEYYSNKVVNEPADAGLMGFGQTRMKIYQAKMYASMISCAFEITKSDEVKTAWVDLKGTIQQDQQTQASIAKALTKK